ncbi:MAG: YcxB family protein [Ruminococcaceae bacterium]|nr:YcxB family protein [Oscillospiraceae bacterium]
MEKIQIKYNNTLTEIETGYKLFQHKYMLKRSIIFSLVYAIAAGIGISFIIRDYTNFPGYILFVIGLGMVFSTWARPYYARKRLIKTLQSFSDEKYSAVFEDTRIVIDTEILPEDQTETVAITSRGVMTMDQDMEIPEEQEIKHDKTKIELRSNTLDSMETHEMFLLFVNRSLIYIFPKRCLTEEEVGKLKNYFEDKNI